MRKAGRLLSENLLTQEFLRYLLVGGITVVLDFAVLIFMRAVLGAPLWFATTIAFSAIVVNFALNRSWVFQSGPGLMMRVLRYAALVLVNYAITVVVVLGMTSLGVFYLVSKAFAVALCVLLNFFAYRHWVFAR